MEAFLAAYGYPALFVLSLIAASPVPMGSEWLLAIMLIKQHDPSLSVAVATLGNTLGACLTWAIGLYGGPFLIRRVLRIDAASETKALQIYQRYGVWSLLFSWTPVIGDPLCLIGGILRVDLSRFILLVSIGKLARYAFVAWITLQGLQILQP